MTRRTLKGDLRALWLSERFWALVVWASWTAIMAVLLSAWWLDLTSPAIIATTAP